MSVTANQQQQILRLQKTNLAHRLLLFRYNHNVIYILKTKVSLPSANSPQLQQRGTKNEKTINKCNSAYRRAFSFLVRAPNALKPGHCGWRFLSNSSKCRSHRNSWRDTSALRRIPHHPWHNKVRLKRVHGTTKKRETSSTNNLKPNDGTNRPANNREHQQTRFLNNVNARNQEKSVFTTRNIQM